MLTLAGPLQPYPQIAPQPAGPQTNGPLGAAVLVVRLVGLGVGAFVPARRYDPGLCSPRVADSAATSVVA
jgi:hypothetical protein